MEEQQVDIHARVPYRISPSVPNRVTDPFENNNSDVTALARCACGSRNPVLGRELFSRPDGFWQKKKEKQILSAGAI